MRIVTLFLKRIYAIKVRSRQTALARWSRGRLARQTKNRPSVAWHEKWVPIYTLLEILRFPVARRGPAVISAANIPNARA